jgi:hypothetical protein
MAVQYSIEYVNSTVEVRASGIPDRASLTQMWKDIIAACKEHHCFSILGIANMDRPLSLADAIDHQAIFPEAGVTIDHRIAWVQEGTPLVGRYIVETRTSRWSFCPLLFN